MNYHAPDGPKGILSSRGITYSILTFVSFFWTSSVLGKRISKAPFLKLVLTLSVCTSVGSSNLRGKER
jgi:hypothetical protein